MFVPVVILLKSHSAESDLDLHTCEIRYLDGHCCCYGRSTAGTYLYILHLCSRDELEVTLISAMNIPYEWDLAVKGPPKEADLLFWRRYVTIRASSFVRAVAFVRVSTGEENLLLQIFSVMCRTVFFRLFLSTVTNGRTSFAKL